MSGEGTCLDTSLAGHERPAERQEDDAARRPCRYDAPSTHPVCHPFPVALLTCTCATPSYHKHRRALKEA